MFMKERVKQPKIISVSVLACLAKKNEKASDFLHLLHKE